MIAGGVVDYKTALHLMRTGAAGVIVGYGGAEGVTTTGPVLGVEVHMATAIADAAAARRDYLDETGGRYVHVLADGDIYTSGDIARAVACGADAVVASAAAGALCRPAGGRDQTRALNMPRGHVAKRTRRPRCDAQRGPRVRRARPTARATPGGLVCHGRGYLTSRIRYGSVGPQPPGLVGRGAAARPRRWSGDSWSEA